MCKWRLRNVVCPCWLLEASLPFSLWQLVTPLPFAAQIRQTKAIETFLLVSKRMLLGWIMRLYLHAKVFSAFFCLNSNWLWRLLQKPPHKLLGTLKLFLACGPLIMSLQWMHKSRFLCCLWRKKSLKRLNWEMQLDSLRRSKPVTIASSEPSTGCLKTWWKNCDHII